MLLWILAGKSLQDVCFHFLWVDSYKWDCWETGLSSCPTFFFHVQLFKKLPKLLISNRTTVYPNSQAPSSPQIRLAWSIGPSFLWAADLWLQGIFRKSKEVQRKSLFTWTGFSRILNSPNSPSPMLVPLRELARIINGVHCFPSLAASLKE